MTSVSLLFSKKNKLKIMLTQTVQIVDAQLANHFDYVNYSSLNATQKEKVLLALNYELNVYGYVPATEIVSVEYDKASDLWQMKYFNEDELLLTYTWYDLTFVNALRQSPEPTEVFEPSEEIVKVGVELRQEFPSLQIITKGSQVILKHGSVAFCFLSTDGKLQWLNKKWDCGNSWVNHEVGTYYYTQSQMKGVYAQLRSDIWFDLEVVSVA